MFSLGTVISALIIEKTSAVIVLAWLYYTETRKKKQSQNIDNLPILVTCLSGNLPILSKVVDDPVAHGSTQ